MTKSNKSASASRVKAFRERLEGSSYKRVEAYVTEEEKAQIEALKSSLSLTSDAAISGLIRLGLGTYQTQAASSSGYSRAVSASAQVATPVGARAAAQPEAVMFAASASPLRSAVSVQAMPVGSSFETPGAQVPEVSETPQAETDANPIARFFQQRKKSS